MEASGREVLELVSALQAGVDDDEQWVAALDRLSDAFGGAALFLGSTRRDGSKFELSGHRIAPEWIEMVNGPLASRDANPVFDLVSHELREGRQSGILQPLILSRLIKLKEFRQSAIYRQAMQPAGFEYVMAMALEADSGSAISLTLVRPRSEGDFGNTDCELVKLIGPHLAAALRLRRRLAVAASGELLIDSIGHPVVMLSEAGDVLHANRLARSLFDRRDAIWLRQGRLCCAFGDDHQRLGAAIAEVARAARGASLSPQPLIKIRREDRESSLIARLLPLGPSRTCVPTAGTTQMPVVALMLHDPSRQISPTIELLQSGLGLSRAEAMVAYRVWEGDGVDASARALGLSPNTVKSHLKTIFERLDVHRQSGLVQRIALMLAELGGEKER